MRPLVLRLGQLEIIPNRCPQVRWFSVADCAADIYCSPSEKMLLDAGKYVRRRDVCPPAGASTHGESFGPGVNL